LEKERPTGKLTVDAGDEIGMLPTKRYEVPAGSFL
jgi:hypothetical protein